MLFLITQVHTPENCPIETPKGAHAYHADPQKANVKLLGMWRGGPNHKIYYLVETENHEAIERFLKPGFKKTVSRVVPVTQMV